MHSTQHMSLPVSVPSRLQARAAQGRLIAVALSLSGMACAGPAWAAGENMAYFAKEFGMSFATLVNWNTSKLKADITTPEGVRSGRYTQVGERRRLALDEPFSSVGYEFDRCGQQVAVRYDTLVFIYERLSGDASKGQTAVNTVGQRVVTEGCDAGLTEPIGSEDDPGDPVSHLAMRKRPAMADLNQAGARLAGFSENDRLAYLNLIDDVVTFNGAGQVSFLHTGATYPEALSQDGWRVVQLPSGPRGYTRLWKDDKTRQEVWFVADFVNGKPAWVEEADMVKPDAAPDFGGTAGAARNWQTAFTFSDFQFRLYPDGNGVTYSPSSGGISPLTWGFSASPLGSAVQITRQNTSLLRVRTWEPLTRAGKWQWSLEGETWTWSDGSTTQILPRVMAYLDKGPGTPPVAGQGHAASVRVARDPRVARLPGSLRRAP